METSKCRSCGKEIVWCLTASGKRAPIDVELSLTGNVIICGDECRVVNRKKEPGFEGVPLHTNHFVTCPDREKWKS